MIGGQAGRGAFADSKCVAPVQDDRPPDLDETAKALVNTKIIESTDKVSGCATKVPFSALVGRALSHHPKRMPNSRQRHQWTANHSYTSS